MTRRYRAVAVVLGVAARLLVASPALAQSASDQAAAEALFDQGKVAMAARNYREACPKFFESNRLDEGIGTSLWLAECYEKSGQTASAWAQFREAAAQAVKTSDPREKIARKRALALEPHLAKLVVTVPLSARLPGLHVARDGREVAAPLWGASVPIDPGPHTVVVSAPDHRPATLHVDIHAGPGEQTLDVPTLPEAPTPSADTPAAPAAEAPVAVDAPAPPTEAPRGRMPPRRIAAIGAGAAGVIAVALGSYFGIEAISDLSASNGAGQCTSKNACNATGVSDRASASSSATASTILFIAGGAAIVGGVALWLTAPSGVSSAAPRASSLAPWVDPRAGAGGVVLRSDF